ncbi:putative ribosomal N-acetyltransferase YdaF [compost metagenome]
MLQGKRTRIRALAEDDLDDLHRWWNMPELWLHIGSRQKLSSRLELEAWFDAEGEKLTQEGRTFAILDEDERLIGTTWYGAFDPTDRQTTVGLYLGDAETRGKGYGQDALETLLSYLFDDLGLHKVRLYVLSTNQRAIACYDRIGFQTEGTLRDHRFFAGSFHDFLAMGILAPEWRRSRSQRA